MSVCLIAMQEADVRWLVDALHGGDLGNDLEALRRARASLWSALGKGSQEADRITRGALEDGLAVLDANSERFPSKAAAPA